MREGIECPACCTLFLADSTLIKGEPCEECAEEIARRLVALFGFAGPPLPPIVKQ